MPDLKQMNTWIEPEYVDEIERLAEQHGWSKARAIRTAIRTLSLVMGKHDDAPRDADPDMQDLYARISREIPGELVEVAHSVAFMRLGEAPALQLEDWVIWEDAATGELLAREQTGEQRFCRVVNGRIEKLTTPAEALLN